MVRLTEEMVVARSRISDLTSVKKLNCWGSELTDISILRELKKVEVVSLSVNNICTLQDFQHCMNLRDLFVRKNNIKDLNEVCYLQNLPNLRNLWLGENPCADRDDYRLAVLQILPNLEKLDDKHVTVDEINSAMSRAKILIHPLEMDSSPPQSNPASPQEVSEYYEEPEPHRNRRYSSSSDPRSYDETHTHEEYQDTDRKNANYNSSLPPQYSQNHYDYELQNGQTKILKEEGKIDSRKPEVYKDYEDRAVSKHNGDYDDRRGYNANYMERSSDQRSQVPSSRSYCSAELMDDERNLEKINYDYENRRQNDYEDVHHSKRSSIHEREDSRDVPGWVKHSEKDKCHFHYHRRPVTRNSNILSAVLCLVKELDYPSLEVVEMAVRNRMDELEE